MTGRARWLPSGTRMSLGDGAERAVVHPYISDGVERGFEIVCLFDCLFVARSDPRIH